MTDLIARKCVPCRGDAQKLTQEEAQKMLPQVPGWEVAEGPSSLHREFKFKNFKEALAFVNRVGEIAEFEGHHPNITLHDWNRVTLELYTLATGGLHENDFILAAKIGGIACGSP